MAEQFEKHYEYSPYNFNLLKRKTNVEERIQLIARSIEWRHQMISFYTLKWARVSSILRTHEDFNVAWIIIAIILFLFLLKLTRQEYGRDSVWENNGWERNRVSTTCINKKHKTVHFTAQEAIQLQSTYNVETG